jgi:hypothetical protein
MKAYVADFETTVPKPRKVEMDEDGEAVFENPEFDVSTRVWAWGVCEIGNVENFVYGTTIEGFMDWCKEENKQIYFHNLKFDGEFIIYHMLKNMRYCYSPTKPSKSFNTIISNTGQFYNIEVIFERKNKKYKKVEIFDSLKKLPFSVEKIGKDFGLAFEKVEVGEDFYTRFRPADHELTEEEITYLKGDVQTVAAALGIQFEQDMTHMTVGSDALNGFKKILGKGDKKLGRKLFERDFPILPINIDTDIRQAYRGGYVYVKEDCAGEDIGWGKVFDVNSLYPWAMRTCLLPYGMPLAFTGPYVQDDQYPIYIQRIKCTFRLKKDHLPMIQLKNNSRFIQTEYLKTSMDKLGNDEVEIVLTSVDLALFFEHYDVTVLEWGKGWKFKCATGMFDEYIDYWMHVKETSKGAIRALAKLMLNSLYGKFAKNPNVDMKMPYLNDEGAISYQLLEQDLSDPVYTAMGAFITAYAREKTIRTAQSIYDRFIYADTDSLHIIGDDVPDIEVHPTHLGAWKHEGDFTRARFLRAKTYIEEMDGVLHVTCAGMPENVKKLVTWENFQPGLSLEGKLMPFHVPGGIVLQPINFTLAGAAAEPDLFTLQKKWLKAFDIDVIKEGVHQHGYIQTIQKGQRYYGEYHEFSRSVKSKYFRKSGLPIDVFADLTGLDLNDLLEKLRGA